MERRLNDWFIILRSHYDSNKTQRSTRGEFGYRRFRESWGCYAQVVMGGSGEVGVVMSRLGVNGLMCGSSMQ